MLHLRSRILLTLAVVALAFLGCLWIVQDAALLKSFLDLERSNAVANLERGTAALKNEVQFVGDFVSDWSGWDDTYKFIDDHNNEFVQSNLMNEVFRADSFDFLSFVNPSGTELWRGAQIGDQKVEISELPIGQWPLDHVLLQPRAQDELSSGILVTEHGPLLVASRPITNSARLAPPRGWIVMARFLSAARLEKLAKQTNLTLHIRPVSTALAPSEATALARLRTGSDHDLTAVDDQHLIATGIVKGLTGDRDDLLVRVDLPRRILAQGRTTISFTFGIMCVAVLLLFGVLASLLQRIVVSPLTRLKDHTLAIRASDDLTRRCNTTRNDEIGTLAQEFDRMVERLAASQAQQIRHARQGGMAEVARIVLHDVGNALQAVTASAEVIRRKLSTGTVDDLDRTCNMLGSHTHDVGPWLSSDAKGRQVPTFLVALAGSLADEHAAMKQELGQLVEGLDHIQQLVHRENAHADSRGAIESVQPIDLVDEAIRLSAANDQGVSFDIDVRTSATLRTEKHRVLAVLINLLRNAAHSVRKVPPSRRRIRISVTDSGRDQLRFQVEDDGVGIDRSDLARIFQSGYSTRPDSNGLGLHGCANSIGELGGSVHAESEGPDRGARFVVVLPRSCVVMETCS